MVSLDNFAGLIFMDAYTHVHYALYNQAYFVGLIFTVKQSSAKTGPLENFPLYGRAHAQWRIQWGGGVRVLEHPPKAQEYIKDLSLYQ